MSASVISTIVAPARGEQRARGVAAIRSAAQPVARVVHRDGRVETRADVVDTEHVDEVLRELERARGERVDLGAPVGSSSA